MQKDIHLSELTSKQTLASQYFPDSRPATAEIHFMSWVNRCKPLLKELQATGYRKNCHFLTPRQQKIIFKYLGNPHEYVNKA